MSTNPKCNVEGGWAPVPHWLFDSPALSSSEKLVAWGYHRGAFGSSTTTTISETRIAEAVHLDRKTVRSATRRLKELGVILQSAAWKNGNKRQYEIALNKPEALLKLEASPGETTPRSRRKAPGEITPRSDAVTGGNGTQVPGESTPTIKSSIRTQIQESASLDETLPTNVTTDEPGDFPSIGDSAPQADAGGDADIHSDGELGDSDMIGNSADAKPDVGGDESGNNLLQIGNAGGDWFNGPSEVDDASPLERDDADDVIDEVFGGGTSSRAEWSEQQAEVSTRYVYPDGRSASGDYDDLQYDLEALHLPWVCGEPLNRGDLDKLVALRGVEFCQMWTWWLKRKVASEYAKGRPVRNPTGLYRRAIEEGWSVSSAWPEFDETKHTVAAREEARTARDSRPGSACSQQEVDEFADAVERGEVRLTQYPVFLVRRIEQTLAARDDARLDLEEIPF